MNKTPVTKPDYQKQLDLIIEELSNQRLPIGSIKPTLLLHACCAPCSSYVMEYLSHFFSITIYYYNPNIYPRQEYERRLKELQNFLPGFPPALNTDIKLQTTLYNPEEYYSATNVRNEPGLQTEPERGERCRRCYLFRMKHAYQFACENHYDWFTTTLSISPFKDAAKINTIGSNLEKEQTALTNNSFVTKWLPSDFKKKNGFLRSLQLSAEYDLYRQDYCGCIYSKQNTEACRERARDRSGNTGTAPKGL